MATPRRVQVDKLFTAELAILNAIVEVEMLLPDKHLSKAIFLLSKAKDKVADYYDERLKETDSV